MDLSERETETEEKENLETERGRQEEKKKKTFFFFLEEFCSDSAAVASKQAFSWMSPGKVAKSLFTCKNMLFIFQSLLVILEIADSRAQVQSPQTLL